MREQRHDSHLNDDQVERLEERSPLLEKIEVTNSRDDDIDMVPILLKVYFRHRATRFQSSDSVTYEHSRRLRSTCVVAGHESFDTRSKMRWYIGDGI